MNLKKLLMPGVGSLVGILLAVGIGALLMLDPRSLPFLGKSGVIGERIGRRLSHLSYEVLFAPRPIIKPNEAVMVYIDDESYRTLNQKYDQLWDRTLYGKLLERLKVEGAKAVCFDIVFSDPGPNPEADAYFAKAIKDFGNVILAADWAPATSGQVGSIVVPPIDMFAEGAANMGTAELYPDEDLFIRRHFAGNWGELVSSLSWATAEVVGAEITKNEKIKFVPERWINYYGPPGRSIPSVSFYQVIADGPRQYPTNYFRNKVVFVGSKILTVKATERKDEYRSPFSFWLQDSDTRQRKYMPGVEIQATVFLNLLRNDWISRVPFRTDLLVVLLTGLIFGFVLPQLRPFTTALIAIASSALFAFAAYYLFVYHRTWYSWFIVSGIQIPIAALWSIVFVSLNLYVQKKLVEQSLSMYVSPSRVKQILKNQEMLKPGAEKQEVSILFSDIANFTTMSEGMDSDELANLMNRYFETTVGQCIHPAQGTVIKFIGDAIFAIWNAPEPQASHQELACKGALLLRNHARSFTFKPGLDVVTRVGLHCGVANVGNFGSSTRIDYTALGENINLASRMEGLNKYLGTIVLITGEIYASVEGKFCTRYCGKFQLKGFEKAVDVHELLGSAADIESTKIWRDSYGNALKEFEKGEFDAAEAGFRCVLEQHPEDGPAQFMLKQIKELRTHPPEDGWDGVIELKDK